MGHCLIRKRHYKQTTFGDVRITKIGTWNANFTYTATTAGTYIVTGLETNMGVSVSSGGKLLYSNKNYHWCVVADLPINGVLSITSPSACIMGMVPVTGVALDQIVTVGKSNATARSTLSNQPNGTLFIGAASYIWHSCASGSGRGVRAGGTNTTVTQQISNSGWNDIYGNWGNEMIGSFVPTSSTNSFYIEGYLDSPEYGNSCTSWLFQLAKKV